MASKKIIKEARKRIKNYKRALKFLDNCREFTYDKFIEVQHILGVANPESDPQTMRTWESRVHILPGPGHSGGADAVRMVIKDTCIQGIAAFEEICQKLDK